jgi:hypothetical protein
MIFSFGCMIAESAVTGKLALGRSPEMLHALGRRITLLASDRSTITTWFVSLTVSRLSVSAGTILRKVSVRTYTQMKWSDSKVRDWKLMDPG